MWPGNTLPVTAQDRENGFADSYNAGNAPASHRGTARTRGKHERQRCKGTGRQHGARARCGAGRGASAGKEKESESRFRHYGKGPWAAAIPHWRWSSLLFQMYASTFSAFDAMTLRSWHIISCWCSPSSCIRHGRASAAAIPAPPCSMPCVSLLGCSRSAIILNYTEITLRGGYFARRLLRGLCQRIICFENGPARGRQPLRRWRACFSSTTSRGNDSRRVRAYRVFLGSRRQ